MKLSPATVNHNILITVTDFFFGGNFAVRNSTNQYQRFALGHVCAFLEALTNADTDGRVVVYHETEGLFVVFIFFYSTNMSVGASTCQSSNVVLAGAVVDVNYFPFFTPKIIIIIIRRSYVLFAHCNGPLSTQRQKLSQ